MYELLIKEYINKLSINDIKKYASNNSIYINDTDAKNIYEFLLKNWKELYRKKDVTLLYELKNKLSDNTYNEVINLFNKYKNMY